MSWLHLGKYPLTNNLLKQWVYTFQIVVQRSNLLLSPNLAQVSTCLDEKTFREGVKTQPECYTFIWHGRQYRT